MSVVVAHYRHGPTRRRRGSRSRSSRCAISFTPSVLVRKGRRDREADRSARQTASACPNTSRPGPCGAAAFCRRVRRRSRKDNTWFMERLPEQSHGGATGFTPPPGVEFHYIPPTTNMGEMMVNGELDATLLYLNRTNLIDRSRADLERRDDIRTLFPDPDAEANRYYTKTGMFPINHTLVVRRSLLEREPWIARSLYDAFARAKARWHEANATATARTVLRDRRPRSGAARRRSRAIRCRTASSPRAANWKRSRATTTNRASPSASSDSKSSSRRARWSYETSRVLGRRARRWPIFPARARRKALDQAPHLGFARQRHRRRAVGPAERDLPKARTRRRGHGDEQRRRDHRGGARRFARNRERQSVGTAVRAHQGRAVRSRGAGVALEYRRSDIGPHRRERLAHPHRPRSQRQDLSVPALGDLYQIAIGAWIDQRGGDSRTVRFLELPHRAAAEAIASGRVDCANIAEPILSDALAKRKGPGHRSRAGCDRQALHRDGLLLRRRLRGKKRRRAGPLPQRLVRSARPTPTRTAARWFRSWRNTAASKRRSSRR